MKGIPVYLVISHNSALHFWRTFAGNRSALKPVRNSQAMPAPLPLSAELLGELAADGFTPSARRPIDLLFGAAVARPRTDIATPRVFSGKLPGGSLLALSERVAITSPELTFALVSRGTSRQKLALIGSELCSTYAHRRVGEPFAERAPLTSADELQRFCLQLAPGGHSEAYEAARYVFDNAASPMEAKLALLLSLPTRMGGYGLPRPELNRPFALSAQAQAIYPHSFCRLDLSWAGTNLDVEYDGSGDEHSGDMHAKDIARLAALRLDGIDTLVLAKQQVYDSQAFAQMAQVIAGKLTGQPRRAWRVRAKEFEAKQQELRRELNLQ